jgi:hypothetical protein
MHQMMRHYGCDPVPEPAVVPTFSALNTERAVHVGFVASWRHPGPPVASYAPLTLTTWLDPTVHGTVDGPVLAEVDQGTVSVGPVAAVAPAPAPPGAPVVKWTAPLTYDPRLPDGRVAAGRHTIKVTWRVSAHGKTAAFTGAIDVEVTADGVVRAVGNQGADLETDPLPLGLRYGAIIDATPEPGGGHRLAVRLPAGIEATSFAWRASAGRLDPDGAIALFRAPVAGERPTVTCVVRGRCNSVGVATFRP